MHKLSRTFQGSSCEELCYLRVSPVIPGLLIFPLSFALVSPRRSACNVRGIGWLLGYGGLSRTRTPLKMPDLKHVAMPSDCIGPDLPRLATWLSAFACAV